ncbi:MAG: hypothetical protein IJ055_02760 [Oscillospiraceae bacterium]|nr:hypothetical protein [Oscillospiraceae bacterium]
MKRRQKRTMLIGGIAAALFITALAVLAALYLSRQRVNVFRPATVDIEVKEGTKKDEQLERTMELDEETGRVEKPVEISDTRSRAQEALRVCLVPMWYDSEERVCGSLFRIGTPAMNSEETALVYTDGDITITLGLHEGWKESGWEYRSDGCFYYTGALLSGKLTPQLLDSVVLNDDAYALTEDYTLRIDVLADAIQTSGDAPATRGWTE